MAMKSWTLDWQDEEEITHPGQRAPLGASVLVVENDPSAPVESRLEGDGYQVHVAASARDLLATLESIRREAFPCESLDLVVMDHPIGRSSGLDVVRAMRASGWDVPVILLVEASSLELRREAASLGVTVVCRPFDLDDLSHVAIASLVLGGVDEVA